MKLRWPPFNVISTHVLGLLIGCLLPVADAIGVECECVTFDSTFGKEHGVFTSPDWPTPYDENIECVLYRFVGSEQQIVRVYFEEFDLQKTNMDCIFGDYVKLFLHLGDEAAVNEVTPFNSVLCGKLSDIEQTHYSSGRALIFEFHSDFRRSNSTGFRGTFQFLNKDQFMTEGALIEDTACDFVMESINRTEGRFFSPQYPSNYPRESRCSYQFLGRETERVKLMFGQIRLQKGDYSCYNAPDKITVRDGRDMSAPVIGTLCNRNMWVELVSTGPDLLVIFTASSHFPGRGFFGNFSFVEILPPPPISASIDQNMYPAYHPDKVSWDIFGSFPQHGTHANGSCDMVISSNMSKNGTITSPNYPNTYPGNIKCTYHFQGEGKERVQIKFTDFDLYKSTDDSRDCENVDSVVVFITIKGQRERVDNFCGNTLPVQIMSNEHRMTVIFQSHATASQPVKGFRAIYQFVTNFGIPSGRQDPQGVCTFIYNSSEVSNGTFTTPNYPGVYPRDTECHYLFYGKDKEKIHIQFAYFDVEGVPPCTSDTASDYVEFSNFKTVDRKIPRHCGNMKPNKIESDSDFFRVAFRSNDKFDGTGFEAFYQFRGVHESGRIRHVHNVSCIPSLRKYHGVTVQVFALFVILMTTYGRFY
ncbi:tolloid-like protein 1 isoform X4 [Varroa destructor]|uniref:CUB domain-containing protein n=1 Tax=Varroa destructor TaxID=109461 RepID=A0A7M7JRG0_VARDE|nr:tolloid-like protein 1 isoform X4 [Varroa destructor]